MMTYRKLAPALAAAIGLSLCGVAAGYAQDGAGAPPAQGQGGQHKHWDPAAMKAHMEARRAEHVKFLHDALTIRPDQEAAFQAFVGSMHHGGDKDGMHRGMRHGMGDKAKDGAERESLTTPQRLDRMQKRMAERDARFQQHADAVKAFYAALSPEQEHAFDALMKMHGGHGGHRHGMHGGMHRGGGMHHGMHGPEGAPPSPQG
jgi:protein CpxP